MDDPRTALHKLISVAMCVKKRNTQEFMEYLADQINAAAAAIGVGPQVEFRGFSNEFHYLCGGSSEPRIDLDKLTLAECEEADRQISGEE